jgi:glycosyltransferase 2 family protein
MRKFIFALVFLLGILFILTRFTEINQIAQTIERGKWIYVFPAILIQCLWFLNNGLSYHYIYQLLGMDVKFARLSRLAIASNFINIIAPIGGMSGITVFLDDAHRKNLSRARVMVASTLYILIDYIGFIFVLVIGLGILANRNNLTAAEIGASMILGIGALGLAILVYLGMYSGRVLGIVLSWSSRQINKITWLFLHRNWLSQDRAIEFAQDIEEGLQSLKRKPTEIFRLVGLAILGKTWLIGILTMMFLAFQVTPSLDVLIAAFSIGFLFLIVSPTPQGLGFVEGALTLTLTSLFVPLAEATVIVVAYRGMTFWLPVVVGMISFRTLQQNN